jgi:hypothetical protein
MAPKVLNSAMTYIFVTSGLIRLKAILDLKHQTDLGHDWS